MPFQNKVKVNWRKLIFLALGAVAYYFSMSPFSWAPAAPLGIALIAGSALNSFWILFVAGALLNLTLIFWLTPVTVVGWLFLSLLLGVLWAVPFWYFGKTKNSLIAAALWVSIECLRGLLGFGWLPIAASSINSPIFLHWARLGGEGLLGFIIVFLAFSLVKTFLEKNPAQKISRVRGLFLLVLLVVAGGWGLGKMPVSNAGKVRVGVVQPNTPMKLETDLENYYAMDNLKNLTNLLRDDAQIIFWPEQSTPCEVGADPFKRQWVEQGAKFLGVPLVSGILWQEEGRYYNSVAVFNPQKGVEPLSYKKRRLVMFGEYIPFSQFKWAHSLTPIVESFTAGREGVVLNVNGVKLWPLICYEDGFDDLSWGAAPQADAIAVFINDGWFGWGAQAQHAAHSVLRAVEQGLPVLRVANNGYSGVVTPAGKTDYLQINGDKTQPMSAVMDLKLERVSTVYAATSIYWRIGFAVLTILGCWWDWRVSGQTSKNMKN